MVIKQQFDSGLATVSKYNNMCIHAHMYTYTVYINIFVFCIQTISIYNDKLSVKFI